MRKLFRQSRIGCHHSDRKTRSRLKERAFFNRFIKKMCCGIERKIRNKTRCNYKLKNCIGFDTQKLKFWPFSLRPVDIFSLLFFRPHASSWNTKSYKNQNLFSTRFSMKNQKVRSLRVSYFIKLVLISRDARSSEKKGMKIFLDRFIMRFCLCFIFSRWQCYYAFPSFIICTWRKKGKKTCSILIEKRVTVVLSVLKLPFRI